MIIYNFGLLLEAMSTKYHSIHGKDKVFPNGLRYFSKLEPLISLSSLSNKPTHLAYLSKN